MTRSFTAQKVVDDIYWVGAIDWEIDDFHGYTTRRGSTYNAYLVLDETVTLIDTVKAPFVPEMLQRVASLIDPSKIELIVSNHSEMDHSGGLPETLRAVKPKKLLASVMGEKALGRHFELDCAVTPVKDGETLSIGKRELHFIETRMLHWPDSMFTYVSPDRVLFSQDAFGMHLASGERFADQIDPAVLEEEAARYYANILLPFSPLVLKLLEKVKTSALEIDVIAPDHGPIWRKDLDRIVRRYATWAKQTPTMKAVVVYDTMWHSTERMAKAVAEGLVAGGASVKVVSLGTRHRSDAVTELLDAGALVVGSPTLNNQMFPTVADFLAYLKGLKPRNLVGAAFGSYGWSGEAAKLIRQELESMKVTIAADEVRCNYVPKEKDLADCRTLGETVAKVLKEACEA
ncbi:MAG TPA: FprA family A-type flavoprotein [Planctomycetota bacterium]|nr:FprA family A-type flavoprotein [Planctomycetota bacterium]